MHAQIFVSHSSKDGKLAMTIAAALERRGLSCWLSSRDIGAGENFQEAIVEAIRRARAMVLVFSHNANDSAEIKKELALAGQYGTIVIPVRAEEVVPTGAFKYELATRQWVDLFENWEQAIERLGEQIRRIDTPAQAGATAPSTPVARRSGRRAAGWLIGAAALAAAAVAAFALRSGAPGSPLSWAASLSPSVSARPELATPCLRATPAATTRDDIRATLVKLDFYDAKRNPTGKGVKHQYAQEIVGGAVTVGDRATALMWQKGGSDRDDMTQAEAAAYIDKLNGAKYAGFADWRLPTLEEAMSLMEPQASDGCHIDLAFQRPPFFIWTSDQAPGEKEGIVVYYCDGTLAGEPTSFNASVRAVRTY
jgi:hypothetical protein